MNNFVFSNDPLLYNQIVPRTGPAQDPQQAGAELKAQLDSLASQYQALQQNMQNPPQPKDVLGEIDELVKGLDTDILTELSDNQEFTELNNCLQALIQEEIMKTVKWKINSNPDAISKMNRIKSSAVNSDFFHNSILRPSQKNQCIKSNSISSKRTVSPSSIPIFSSSSIIPRFLMQR